MPSKQEDDRLVELALKNRLVTEDQVGRARKRWEEEAAQGHEAELADLMVEADYLTRTQADGLREEVKRSKPSERLGSYELVEEVGEGSTGTVYRARHRGLDSIVALKVLSPELARDPRFLERFQREARAAAALSHPNLVRAFDAGEAEGYHYIATEYVEGQSLDVILDRRGTLPVEEAADVIGQIAAALSQAHKHKVVHRDVKPHNVMLDENGNVAKLADLGLARREEDYGTTEPGTALGTPYYMSPEQARDPTSVDHRTDIYSLGATFFHALVGRVPFEGRSAYEVASKHQNEEPPPVSKLRPDVPAEVSSVVQKMMAKDPEQRFQTAYEVMDALGRALGRDQSPDVKSEAPRHSQVLVLSATVAAAVTMVVLVAVKTISTPVSEKLPVPPERSEVEAEVVEPVVEVKAPPPAPPPSPEAPENMVYVPGGVLRAGHRDTNNAYPPIAVSRGPFFIDKYEVTNAQYQEFLDETGGKPPEHWVGGSLPPGRESHPVSGATWHEATAYAKWVGKRLPTEFEWERAARGRDGRLYPWGETFEAAKCNTVERLSGTTFQWYREVVKWHRAWEDTAEGRVSLALGGATLPVGTPQEGVSPAGCYNMAGNVSEWTSSSFVKYSDVIAGVKTKSKWKVARGADWHFYEHGARCAYRWGREPDERVLWLGFRCAMDVESAPANQHEVPR